MITWIWLACRPAAQPDDSHAVDFGVHGQTDLLAPAGLVASAILEVDRPATGESDLTVRSLTATRLLLSCDPSTHPAEAVLTLTDDRGVTMDVALTCGETDADVVLPAEPLVEINATAVRMKPPTGLGEASTGVALVPVDVSGDVLLLDAEQGRAWRRTPYYTVPDWGLWVTDLVSEVVFWNTDEDCIGNTASGIGQNGECDGSETDRDGTVPDGWRFHHPGFAGSLPGLSGGVFIDAADDVVLFGADEGVGVAWALDASVQTEDHDLGSYDFLQRARPLTGQVPEGMLPFGEQGLDPATGAVYAFIGLNTPNPAAELVDDLPTPELLGRGVFYAQQAYHLPTGSVLDTSPLGVPALAATDGEMVWGVYDGLLRWSDGQGAGVLSTAHLGPVLDVLADEIGGRRVAWLVVETSTGVELVGASPGGVARTGLALPGVPVTAVLDPAPHDVVLAFEAGDSGCDGAWAEHCIAGEHPALIWSGYAQYGLDVIGESGHPVNLFLSPVVETPIDARIDADWTSGQAGCSPELEPREKACCALTWSVENRLEPNLAYLQELGKPLVLGLNPSVEKQARLCGDAGFEAVEARFFQALLDAHDDGVELTHWTHTPYDYDDPSVAASYVEEVGVAWDPPIDTQLEYALFMEGLILQHEPWLDGVPLWASSGNSMDGLTMDWFGATWVDAMRDAGLERGRDPFRFYYFALAGGMADVGDDGFRKKEQVPLDIRQRTHVFEMGSTPDDWYQSGESGMYFVPGTTWLVNAFDPMAYAGVWRETQRWGVELVANDWTLLNRYLRRIVSSSDPDVPKTWYIHLYDVTHPDPSLRALANETEGDKNLGGLDEIDAVLVASGAATWSSLAEIEEEVLAAEE
ncbi:MAG: hypothetical protein GY913_17130 [Proteobacteria bacterium]|nr:hypothetical protein [Pseudomonadota bacterium]MCP4918629.1 hypothetical protein [Pseudomonadota bacterium]